MRAQGVVLGIVLALTAGAAQARPAETTLTVSSGLDNGIPQTLRSVLDRAKAGDRVVFAPGVTVHLIKPLEIWEGLKGLTIDGANGTAKTKIDGGSISVLADNVTITNVDARGISVDWPGGRTAGVTIEKSKLTSLYGRRADRLTVDNDIINGNGEFPAVRLLSTTDTKVTNCEIANDGAVGLFDHDSTRLDVSFNRAIGASFYFASRSVRASWNDLMRSSITVDSIARGSQVHAELNSNDVRSARGAGIDIGVLGVVAKASLHANAVTGSSGFGIELGDGVATAGVDGNVVEKNRAGGIRVLTAHAPYITRGDIRDNGGAGVLVAPGAKAVVDDVSFSGNDGPGIDLAPPGVTPNTVAKTGNPGRNWPELRYDAAKERIVGQSCPRCWIAVYRIEQGARKGNPENGEGFDRIKGLEADADGSFYYPPELDKSITCAEARTITVTATTDGETSEFSPDVHCRYPGLYGHFKTLVEDLLRAEKALRDSRQSLGPSVRQIRNTQIAVGESQHFVDDAVDAASSMASSHDDEMRYADYTKFRHLIEVAQTDLNTAYDALDPHTPANTSPSRFVAYSERAIAGWNAAIDFARHAPQFPPLTPSDRIVEKFSFADASADGEHRNLCIYLQGPARQTGTVKTEPNPGHPNEFPSQTRHFKLDERGHAMLTFQETTVGDIDFVITRTEHDLTTRVTGSQSVPGSELGQRWGLPACTAPG